jgi:hypothetical protein
MCDIGKALSRAFTPPGTGGLEAQLTASENAATTAATNADNALTTAINNATAASLPAADDPSAYAAAQSQMRTLMAQQGAAWSFGKTPTAAPAAVTRVLFGS